MSTVIKGGNLIAAVTGGVFHTVSDINTSTRSETLLVSPASIVATYLIGEGFVDDPVGSASLVWPMFISRMPDVIDVPTDCVAIYDTPGLKDGRLMIGPVIEHYGLQIKARSGEYDDGWTKLEAISVELDSVRNQLVMVNAIEYQIYNIKRAGIVIPLGAELGSKGRQLFTANFLVTLKRIV